MLVQVHRLRLLILPQQIHHHLVQSSWLLWNSARGQHSPQVLGIALPHTTHYSIFNKLFAKQKAILMGTSLYIWLRELRTMTTSPYHNHRYRFQVLIREEHKICHHHVTSAVVEIIPTNLYQSYDQESNQFSHLI